MRCQITHSRVNVFHRTIYRPVEGALELPTAPGLEIQLDPAKIEDRRELDFIS